MSIAAVSGTGVPGRDPVRQASGRVASDGEMSDCAASGGEPARAVPEPVLVVQGVHVTVRGRELLHDVTMQVRPGEVVALIGPNGAGKSTLLSVIAGDRAPQRGRCLIAGREVGAWGARALARHRAVLLQDPQVAFSYRVEDVVAMGRAPWRGTERARHDHRVIAECLGRTEVAHLRDRDVLTLSGGEAGRVHLARVLAQEAPVMLFDEPTAAMDIRHQEATLAMSRELAASGAAVVVVLHDLDAAAAVADRLILLHQGRVRGVGTAREVCTSELLSDVYGWPIDVIEHPVTGRRMVAPRRSGLG